MWKLSDIESTHRIGQTRGRYRPLIVQSQSVDHKLSILRDQDLRESLRRNGNKVSTDSPLVKEMKSTTINRQVVLLISGQADYTWRINQLDPKTTEKTDVRV